MCLLLACGDTIGDDADGELRVGLWGDAPNGQIYSLQGAVFEITGADYFSTDDLPDGATVLDVSLPAGPWRLTLLDGWHVMRGDPDGEPLVEVEAELVSPNPVEFVIADNMVTDVTYVFEIDGEVVPMHDGNIDIDVEFEEDDGICQPEGPQTTLYSIADDASSGHDEGWQSFTAPANVRIEQLWLDWIGDDAPGAVIQIREGVGMDGPLLGEAIFGGLGGLAQGVEIAISTTFDPIDLEAGGTYTLVGEEATGWKMSDASFPGAVSSEGNTTIFNFTLRGHVCD